MLWCYWCKQGTSAMGAYASCQPEVGNAPNTAYVIEKKRRLASLATFRKKLIRRKRTSKSCDHSKVIRDFVSDWSIDEITSLFEEYEATAALKDFTVQANLARPPAPTYKQDLSDLFDYKYCTDVDLVFQGGVFPVHRAILSVRCPYFQELLKKVPGYGAQIAVDIQTPGIDIPMFSALLRYLYTGEFNPYDGTSKAQQLRLTNIDVLMQLCDEFGTPNALHSDLKYLLNSGDYADCILVFSSGENNSCEGYPNDYGFHNRLEVFCHKSVLSARSPFFRSLIQRRQRYSEDKYDRGMVQPTRIVLDEGVIPKRYAKVLLQAIYLDTLNLSCIIRDSTSTNSLSEAQSMVQTGRTHMTVVEEAMEIYQIGRFLELDILTQGCEDLIVESLNLENLVSVLKWSGQAHGSAWVQRQALHFLREEFTQVVQSPVLLELDKATMVELLSSNFLQTSELEVLQAVLRWGEHQLIKRIEEREPNLVSQTAHSVTKKGLRKRDLNDVELREIISELLPLVRVDHVIPPHHETLTQAIKRGLVSTPPSHLVGEDTNYRVNSWIRSKNNGLFVQPRLFTPYAEEIKAIVDEYAAINGQEATRPHCFVSPIPDALYMVESEPPHFAPPTTVDVVAGAMPVPDTDTVSMMVRREKELIGSLTYQNASALIFANRRLLRRQVKLRVVREFNLPDSVADVLEGTSFMDEDQPVRTALCHVRDEGRSKLQPPEFLIEPRTSSLERYGERLSAAMPDVAIASASMSTLHISKPRKAQPNLITSSMDCLHEKHLGLDLGDGTQDNHKFSPQRSVLRRENPRGGSIHYATMGRYLRTSGSPAMYL